MIGTNRFALTELRLRGFKCFHDEVTLPLKKLNLFTGINGKGKSTSLQALLLLHQWVERALELNGNISALELNGKSVRLGTFREVRHQHLPQSKEVLMGLEFTREPEDVLVCNLLIREDEDQPRSAQLAGFEVERFLNNETQGQLKAELIDINGQVPELQCFQDLTYICADRLGPQEFFTWATERRGVVLPQIGVRGEHTAEVLYAGRMTNTLVELQRPEAETPLLPDQASAWLGYVFDGGKFKPGPHSDVVLTLEMNTDGSANYVRPVHIGFGYSYVLPIIVAGLVAKPGSMLIVENPEAHLHPMAQARIGEFLATVAKAGVQVYVESHSEHILNAFRLAVLDKVLPAEQLSVLYFRRDEVAPVLRVPVTEKGGIEIWPEGFFDQRLHDFQRLFGA